MRNLEVMRGKLAEKTKEARALIEAAQKEERSLTAEEREKQDRLMVDIRDMQADIVAEEILQEQESRNAKTVSDPEKDLAEFRSLGEFVKTIHSNPNDKRLKDRYVEAEERQQSQGVGLEGGFLVPDVFSSQLLTVSPDEAIIRPRANVFDGGTSTGFGELHIPALQYSGNNMYAGAQVTWINEGAEKPETDIEFKRVTLHPFEVAAHTLVTDRLLRNAPAIEKIVGTQLRGALIAAEENTFLNGAGGFQPTGIIGHAATIQVPRAGAAAVIYQDLADMLAVFWGRRGVWIVGRDMLPQLMALQDPNNNYIWQPSARDGNPGTLFGMPVMFSDDSPALGVNGDVVLADLSYYLIGDGQGVAIATSKDFLFTSNMTVIKAWKLVDGTPWLTGPLPTSIPTSPFVQLNA
jgi:HK97 family phage major capsid protein